MAREFKETAHTKTDMQRYGERYDHIFNREICKCDLCEEEKAKSLDENNPEPRVICEAFGPCDL